LAEDSISRALAQAIGGLNQIQPVCMMELYLQCDWVNLYECVAVLVRPEISGGNIGESL